jgi:hypothetical protein
MHRPRRVHVARRLVCSIACAALVVTAAGCGSGTADGHSGARGQVQGTVTFEGKPVPAGSQVLFMGTKGGYTATGAVAADGTYRLSYQVAAGLPVGEYVVQVAPPADAGGAGPSDDPAAMVQRMNLSAKGAGAAKGPFPDRYAAVGSSGLTFTVGAGDNTADFALVP